MKINHVFFTQNCISYINKIIENHNIETEVGGSLVGSQLSDTLIVTHASGPGKNAKMFYDSVEIDGEFTTNFCNHLNLISNHRLYYLGDWHTHLSNNLNPSSRDLNAIKRLSKFIPMVYRDTLITVIINHHKPKNIKVYCLGSEQKLVGVSCSEIPNPSWIEEFL
jgi:integrative and conjugative element protein (TIGR02256 family)